LAKNLKNLKKNQKNTVTKFVFAHLIYRHLPGVDDNPYYRSMNKMKNLIILLILSFSTVLCHARIITVDDDATIVNVRLSGIKPPALFLPDQS